MVLSKVEGLTTLSKVEGESRNPFNERRQAAWMPDRVRHDGQKSNTINLLIPKFLNP
jgi:hypothetical protein